MTGDNAPRILFLSGGTAINELARYLCRENPNTLHLVTTFDSGGSSASLRRAFDMPAVGDLRHRLLALADTGDPRNVALVTLLSTRMSADAAEAESVLGRLASGEDQRLKGLTDEAFSFVVMCLDSVASQLPAWFDLGGASIGNLVLSGAWLDNGHSLKRALALLSPLVGARGVVVPITEQSLHLSALLSDGRRLLGQHLLTGKEVPPITSAIAELQLSQSIDHYQKADCSLDREVRELIVGADLICYPPGSFFTSVCANLLPKGLIEALADNPCNKVYVPNLGVDPEQFGHTASDLVNFIVGLSSAEPKRHNTGLTHVLIDRQVSSYLGGFNDHELSVLGVELVTEPLVDPNTQLYEPSALTRSLMRLI